MADIMQQASSWLESQRAQFRTQSVAYTRPPSTSVTVNATISRSEFELDDGAGALLRLETRDYLINAAELAAAGITLPPQPGDTITETAGTVSLTYEVIMPGGKEPARRWSDRWRQRLRIHTSLTARETRT